jgi:hypothetical protein
MPKDKKIEDKSIKKSESSTVREYHFPTLGKTVKAESLEEAQEKVKFKKSNK